MALNVSQKVGGTTPYQKWRMIQEGMVKPFSAFMSKLEDIQYAKKLGKPPDLTGEAMSTKSAIESPQVSKDPSVAKGLGRKYQPSALGSGQEMEGVDTGTLGQGYTGKNGVRGFSALAEKDLFSTADMSDERIEAMVTQRAQDDFIEMAPEDASVKLMAWYQNRYEAAQKAGKIDELEDSMDQMARIVLAKEGKESDALNRKIEHTREMKKMREEYKERRALKAVPSTYGPRSSGEDPTKVELTTLNSRAKSLEANIGRLKAATIPDDEQINAFQIELDSINAQMADILQERWKRRGKKPPKTVKQPGKPPVTATPGPVDTRTLKERLQEKRDRGLSKEDAFREIKEEDTGKTR